MKPIPVRTAKDLMIDLLIDTGPITTVRKLTVFLKGGAAILQSAGHLAYAAEWEYRITVLPSTLTVRQGAANLQTITTDLIHIGLE